MAFTKQNVSKLFDVIIFLLSEVNRKAVKPKLLTLFIAICIVGIIIVGYFFNAIQGLII